MSINAATKDKLLSAARRYFESLDESQLERLLAEEWAKVEQTGMPVRSDDSPGVRVARLLKDSLVTHPEIVAETVEYVALRVLEYFDAAGYDLWVYADLWGKN